MATIGAMKRRFEALDTDEVIKRVMIASEGSVADENVLQMLHGLRKDGEQIAPDYHDADYAASKNSQNPLAGFGTPDLRLTGAFYQGIYVRVEGDRIVTGSTDPKAAALEKKYGKGIYGLSAPYKREVLNEVIRPMLKEKMLAATGIQMK